MVLAAITVPLGALFGLNASLNEEQLIAVIIQIFSVLAFMGAGNAMNDIKDAAIDAINENYHKYSPVDGFLDLKKAICKKFKRDNNLDYNTDQIVVSTGAKQSIANVCMSLINKGDEVVIPTPYWVSYSAMVSLADGIPVFVNPDENANYKVTAKQIESAITDKTKMIMLNSPNNPSGSVFSEQEYLEFSKVLLKYPKIIIVSDEIYEHINYGSKSVSFASLPGMYERTVTVNGISKAFAMTGWRIGYLAAPKVLAKACNKMQGQITSGANCIAQRATIKALEESPERIKYMVDEFKIRRDLIINLVNQVNGFEVKRPPDGAFYIFPEVSDLFGKTFKGQTVNDANDLSMLILEKAHVATVPGDAFGYPNCIRISYSTSREQIEEAIRRIKDLLS